MNRGHLFTEEDVCEHAAPQRQGVVDHATQFRACLLKTDVPGPPCDDGGTNCGEGDGEENNAVHVEDHGRLSGFPDDAGDEHQDGEEGHQVHDGSAGQTVGGLLEDEAVDGETDCCAEHQDVTGCEVHAEDLIQVAAGDEIERTHQGDDTASPCVKGLLLAHACSDHDDEDRGGHGNEREVNCRCGLCSKIAERGVCGHTECCCSDNLGQEGFGYRPFFFDFRKHECAENEQCHAPTGCTQSHGRNFADCQTSNNECASPKDCGTECVK